MSAIAKVVLVQKNPSGAALNDDNLCFSIWLRFVNIEQRLLAPGGFLPHVSLPPTCRLRNATATRAAQVCEDGVIGKNIKN